MFDPTLQKGLSIDRLRSFLLAVDAGGIARAAPRQTTRQSQMSRQIRELEEALGVPLMERRGRVLVPTAAGRTLAEVAREAFAGLGRVAERSTDEPLSLAAGDSILVWWLIPRLAELRQTRPRLVPSVLALASEEVAERVLDGRVDLGIIRHGEVPGGLESSVLGKLTHALYIPRALLRGPRTVEAIVARVPLALQQSEPTLNAPLFSAARRIDHPLAPALRCGTFPQACRAVETGAYGALLPTLARATLPRSRFIEVPVPSSTVRVALVWHPRLRRVRSGALALLSELTAALRFSSSASIS